MNRLFVALFAGLMLLSTDVPAQEPIYFGVRFATSSYLSDVGPTNMLGGSFGRQFAQRYTVITGVDFSEFNAQDKGRITVVTPYAGFKFFFHKWYDGSVTPYVRADIFKTLMRWPNLRESALPIVQEIFNDEEVTLSQRDAEKLLMDILGPWGFDFSFGAEYYISDQFSLGGEFGLRNGYSSSNILLSDTASQSATKMSFHNTFVGVTMNFLI